MTEARELLKYLTGKVFHNFLMSLKPGAEWMFFCSPTDQLSIRSPLSLTHRRILEHAVRVGQSRCPLTGFVCWRGEVRLINGTLFAWVTLFTNFNR